MIFTLSGSLTVSRFLQPKNVSQRIDVNALFSGSLTLLMPEQAKHSEPMCFTLSGMLISDKFSVCLKADSAIVLRPSFKITSLSCLHSLKASDLTTITVDGRIIFSTAVLKKAESPTAVIPSSIVTFFRFLHPENNLSGIVLSPLIITDSRFSQF